MLVNLNVSNNKLQSLPESVGSCFSLEELQANGVFFINIKSSCMHCMSMVMHVFSYLCVRVCFPCVRIHIHVCVFAKLDFVDC